MMTPTETAFAFTALFLAGGALNRLRGSGWQKLGFLNKFNKWVFAVGFALLHGIDEIRLIGVDELTKVPMYSIGWSLVSVFYCFVAMKIGYMVGWDFSPFVGNPPKVENNFLDEIDPDRFKSRPLLRGIYRMAIRGVFWGLLIGMAVQSLWPILAGALMGVVYWFGLTKMQKDWGRVRDGVALSEWIFGGLITVSSFL